jgi:hypothetical protein
MAYARAGDWLVLGFGEQDEERGASSALTVRYRCGSVCVSVCVSVGVGVYLSVSVCVCLSVCVFVCVTFSVGSSSSSLSPVYVFVRAFGCLVQVRGVCPSIYLYTDYAPTFRV